MNNKIFFQRDSLIRREHFGTLVLTLDGKRFVVEDKYFPLLQFIALNPDDALSIPLGTLKEADIIKCLDSLYEKSIITYEKPSIQTKVRCIDNGIFSSDALSFPRTVYWESTGKCNFRCIHCYSQPSNHFFDGIDLAVMKKLVDEMVLNGVEFFNIGGGEPLLYPHIFPLLEYCKNAGLMVEMTTNGSLLSTKNIQRLEESGLHFIQVSLDGACKNTYEKIRIGARFDVLLGNLQALKKAGIVISINTVLMKPNAGEILDILQVCEELGVSFFKISPLMETGRGGTNKQMLQLDLKELKSVYETLVDYQKKHQNTPLKIIFNRNLLKPSIKNLSWMPQGHYGCPAGRTTCGIDSYGNVYPCSYMNNQSLLCGNIQQKTLKEIWSQSHIFDQLRNLSSIKGACGDCEYLDFCAGGCRASAYLRFGTLDASDPLCVVHQ